jgi:hypothetical protein
MLDAISWCQNLCVGYKHGIDWIENKELIKFENIMQNNVG